MKRIYFIISLVSCSVLILEISLTRLFSIYLSYHFAFMVISIAMLGLGSAGTVLSIYPKLKNISNITVYALLAGISIILGYVVSNHIPFDPVKFSWDRMQIFYLALYCLVLSIPFFFSGLLIATAFSVRSEKSELIYGSDLIGAGTGAMAVLGLLNIGGPEYAVLTASTLCFIASFTAGRNHPEKSRIKPRLFSVMLIAVNLLIFVIHPDFINVRLSPYRPFSLSLKYPGAEHLKTYYNSFSRIDTLKSPAVRFAPGLSLRYLEPLPEQIGLSTDGGGMNAVTMADNRVALAFLEFLPSSLAYEIKDKVNVLILEPKAGLQALTAEYYAFKAIDPIGKKAQFSNGIHPIRKKARFELSNGVHKIESNPLMVKIIRDDFGEFSGNIFKRNTWTGLGRSLLNSSQLYDIIDLPMTGTSVTGTFGIAEDYRFTVEAFKQYLRALKKDGFMSISLYLVPPPRTELRILGTVIDALEQDGAGEVSRNIAAIRSWDSITMLVKRTPFNEGEIKLIKDFAGDRRFDLVHYPGIKEHESNLYVKMPSNEYFKYFKSILDPETRALFINNYLFDVKPVHDENPFFHYYLKLKNIKVIYKVMGAKWQYFMEEGYLMPVIFVLVFLLSALMILLPAIVKYKAEVKKKNNLNLSLLSYFAMLGIGFMFVEVTLMQKSILSLEYPAYAFATVLTAVLISSGIGSLISSRFPGLRAVHILPVIGALVLVYSMVFPLLLNLISPYPLKLKIPMVFIVLMPLGLFMGIPFPAGIRLIGQINEALIPWAWAINGCFSVLAPIMTIMLAMALGFKTVLWLGAAAYLLAFVSLRELTKGLKSYAGRK